MVLSARLRPHHSGFILPLAALALLSVARAEPPELDPAKDLPRNPPTEPSNALKTFKIKKGFSVDLVAAEPLVKSPVAMAFDENGRLFVVEMIDYSERRDEHLGRIVLLEDTDGDGHFDKSTVYADNLAWPTGVICYDGGIFVAATPDIVYLKDTDGDNRADLRKTVFTGFGSGVQRLNVQALFNSFNWGMDNRIHGSTAPNGGTVTNLAVPTEKPLNLNGRNFSFDPLTMIMRAESGGGQYGMSFDSHGRKYVCSNSDHLMAYLYDGSYAERNPRFAMPDPLASIAVDGGAAEVYRISPEEPWRVIRTKWRVSGVSEGMIEGGGRSAGYFTGASGVTIYRGDAYPAEFRDNAFTGDVGGNLLHRKIIRQDGVTLKAERPADEQTNEFLASTDTWFRPVQSANAPDGTLYVIDMYRETIEHPWSLPEQLKKHLDLNSGNDRGRIFRILPDGFKQPKPVRLGAATTAQLVATLESPNGWHRDTAARLLFQRQDPATVPLLTNLLATSKSALGRLHALHCLEGLGALGQASFKALQDSDADVRAHALKLVEERLGKGMISPDLSFRLSQLAKDTSPSVRFQLAFTLGLLTDHDRVHLLYELAGRDFSDKWMCAAVLSSLADGAAQMFSILTTGDNSRLSRDRIEFCRQVVMLIGAKYDAREIAGVVDRLAKINNRELVFVTVRALGEGLQRTGRSLPPSDAIKATLAQAGEVALNDRNDEATRLSAIPLLAMTGYADSGATLVRLLATSQPPGVQLAAIAALAHFNEPEVAATLLTHWSTQTPQVRSATIAALLARPERVLVLLQAIEQGTLRPADLTTAQISFLKKSGSETVRTQAAKLFAPTNASKRAEVIKSFEPALQLTGKVEHGRQVYLERCASCHRLENAGYALGPDLVTVKNAGKEKLLVSILDPNAEVAPNFRAFEVETTNGESQVGLVANETAHSLTLKQPFGKELVILRPQIKRIQSQGMSLMPENLETGLTQQDLADLLAYLSH